MVEKAGGGSIPIMGMDDAILMEAGGKPLRIVGEDAQGEVMVQVEHQGQIYRGRGVSTDSVEASAKAFLNAINRVAAGDDGGKR